MSDFHTRRRLLMEEIDSALHAARSSNAALLTHLLGRHDAYDRARADSESIQAGIRAVGGLRDLLRDIPDPRPSGYRDFEPPTSCECAAVAHPPCSFCESPAHQTEEPQ